MKCLRPMVEWSDILLAWRDDTLLLSLIVGTAALWTLVSPFIKTSGYDIILSGKTNINTDE